MPPLFWNYSPENRFFIQVYRRTFAKYRQMYAEALVASVKSGMPPYCIEILENIYSNNKVLMQNDIDRALFYLAVPFTWIAPPPNSQLIRNCLQIAQVMFAEFDCKAPTSEGLLTGVFRTRVAAALSIVNGWNRKVFGRDERIHIWSADLSLKGAETKLGADIAFVFETENSQMATATVVFATCLQAKRANPRLNQNGEANFDIRRFKNKPKTTKEVAQVPSIKDDGYSQLRALKKTTRLGVSCAYLFYHNDENNNISRNVLPFVKEVLDLEPNVQQVNQTNLATETKDFASYFSLLFSRNDLIGVSGQDDAAIARLISNITVANPKRLIAISSSADFGLRVKKALLEIDRVTQIEEVELTHWDLHTMETPDDDGTPDIDLDDLNESFGF